MIMFYEEINKYMATGSKKGCLSVIVPAFAILLILILMSALMTSCRSTKYNLKSQINTERSIENKVEDKSQLDVEENTNQVSKKSTSIAEQIEKEHSSEIHVDIHNIKYRDDGSISEETFVNLNKSNKGKELSGKQAEINKADSLSSEKTDNSKLNIKDEFSETLVTKEKTEVIKEKKESNIPIKISLCIVAVIILLLAVLKIINAIKSMGWTGLWKKITK